MRVHEAGSNEAVEQQEASEEAMKNEDDEMMARLAAVVGVSVKTLGSPLTILQDAFELAEWTKLMVDSFYLRIESSRLMGTTWKCMWVDAFDERGSGGVVMCSEDLARALSASCDQLFSRIQKSLPNAFRAPKKKKARKS